MKNQKEVRNAQTSNKANANTNSKSKAQAKNANQVVRLDKSNEKHDKRVKEDKPRDAREVSVIRYRSPWKTNQVFTVTTYDDGRMLSRCREN